MASTSYGKGQNARRGEHEHLGPLGPLSQPWRMALLEMGMQMGMALPSARLKAVERIRLKKNPWQMARQLFKLPSLRLRKRYKRKIVARQTTCHGSSRPKR